MVGVTHMMVFWVFTPYVLVGLYQHFEGCAASIAGSLNFVQVGAEVIRRRKCVDNVGFGPIRALEGGDGVGLAPSSSQLSFAWCLSYSLSPSIAVTCKIHKCVCIVYKFFFLPFASASIRTKLHPSEDGDALSSKTSEQTHYSTKNPLAGPVIQNGSLCQTQLDSCLHTLSPKEGN